MAGPMLLVSTYLSALMMRYVLGYTEEHRNFNFTAALLYGAIISATDPVAVVALLKELGASKKLSTLIEGESLLNDGTAMVAFFVIMDFVKGDPSNPESLPGASDVFKKFICLAGGGAALGMLFGVIASYILTKIFNNFVLEVNTTIVICYIMFYLAEFVELGFSGILSLVAFGLYMTYSGKTKISVESQHALHHVWGYIGFAAETLIFILSGIIIGDRFLGEASTEPEAVSE